MPDSVATTHVIREGDTSKPDPVTIVIVANPALETPFNSGTFAVDPIVGDPTDFNACVQYVDTSLFGGLPNQAEVFLGDPAIAPLIRVVSLFVTGLPATDANSLVAQDSMSNLAIARRNVFVPFLANFDLRADVVYAVTASPTHDRATAWFTSDDDNGPGTPFAVDGVTFSHRHFNLIPGTVALPVTSKSLTALHEFGHAFSSYTNGSLLDLYVDSPPGFNVRRGRPIPLVFSNLNGIPFASDLIRDGLLYPPTWQSYHPALTNPLFPAVMDNYWQAFDNIPEHCLHDLVTRQFLLDRLHAKLGR